MVDASGKTTADAILAAARVLIMARGYHGFSFADVAEEVGIRKASIYYHFPAKSDLAAAVVAQSLRGIRAHGSALSEAGLDGPAQLQAYCDYWERCIADGSAPFCVAAMLAAELPGLPAELAKPVEQHFTEVRSWMTEILAHGARLGAFQLLQAPGKEADALMAAVHGAMLSARAFGEPATFGAIMSLQLGRLAPRG